MALGLQLFTVQTCAYTCRRGGPEGARAPGAQGRLPRSSTYCRSQYLGTSLVSSLSKSAGITVLTRDAMEWCRTRTSLPHAVGRIGGAGPLAPGPHARYVRRTRYQPPRAFTPQVKNADISVA